MSFIAKKEEKKCIGVEMTFGLGLCLFMSRVVVVVLGRGCIVAKGALACVFDKPWVKFIHGNGQNTKILATMKALVL